MAALAPVQEPAWHRNARRDRQRARGLVLAAGLGFAVPTSVVNSATAALSRHHGSAAEMVRSGPGKLNNSIAQNAWKCLVCSEHDTLEAGAFWVGQHKTHCPKCGLAKPNRPLYFKHSHTYLSSVADRDRRQAAAAGGGGGGGGNEAAAFAAAAAAAVVGHAGSRHLHRRVCQAWRSMLN